MSTKAACMPGSTLVTVPLYTLPTIERWRCRSRYRSVRRLPSWTATRVSIGPAVTTMRLLTAAPLGRAQTTHRLARRGRDVETAEQQQRVAGEQHQAPDEPPRLGEYGENEIRVTLREKGEPALRGAGDALAQELS